MNLAFSRTINGTISLANGDLNLDGNTLTLGASATLSESEGNTIKGTSGVITTTRTFNAGDLSAGVNIAGMGAEITTDADLGSTVITRGHGVQTIGGKESILRYYDIIPTDNSGLDAVFVFHYDDSELNGLNEFGLELFRSTDLGGTWSSQGGTVDTDSETITLSGLDAFSRWTSFDSSISFTDAVSLTGVYDCSVAWGDYDSDGDLDVLLAGDAGSSCITRIYVNEGSGTFTDIVAGLPGIYDCSVAWGDCDNDGDLDLLLAGWTGSSRITRIYHNDGWTTNTVPNAPSNLAASASGQDVTLSWDKSTDAETAADGLTYNLRMGASSGSVEVMSPMADVGSGYRRIPALGNTNHDTTWTIQGLNPGWHYWSVQAIDNAFAGSPFASVDSVYCSGVDMTLSGAVQLDILVLEWTTIPPAAGYWVYGTFNDAFFDPQVESPFGYRLAVTADTTWSSPAGIADPDTNWTYQVIAVDGSDTELGRTNRFGEHEFLMP